MKSRTSKVHYHDILKEMEYIKGLPPTLIIPDMIDWILSCEIKRSKCKNINGTIARQMRECLIKLYCAIGEIQRQKDNTETEKLNKQMEDMKIYLNALKEENSALKKELEEIKKKICASTPVANLTETSEKSTNKDGRRNSKASSTALALGKEIIRRRRLCKWGVPL